MCLGEMWDRVLREEGLYEEGRGERRPKCHEMPALENLKAEKNKHKGLEMESQSSGREEHKEGQWAAV